MLLVDDIQFFSGKSRTQEEFFYAFEALIAARKQIIITSDTYPKEISGMDDRLTSRFDSWPDGCHRTARTGNACGHSDQKGLPGRNPAFRRRRFFRGKTPAFKRS